MDSLLLRMLNISQSYIPEAFNLPYGYIYKLQGSITHRNVEHISVSCNSSFFFAIWLHIQIPMVATHKNG